MAAVKGVNMTKYDAGASGSNWIDKQDVKGHVQIAYDLYEASSLASGSTIDVAQLPTGAKVMSVQLLFDALGASTTLTLGDSSDADRYIASTSTSSAGRSDVLAITGIAYQIGTASGDGRIILTTGGGSITGTIAVTIIYTV